MKKVLPNNKTINYTLDEDQIIKNNSINVDVLCNWTFYFY